MQSQPDGDYKWIMVCKDHLTKSTQIRPTKTKRAPEIAYHLLDVFCTFGAPNVIQSDNGRKLVNVVIPDLALIWEGFMIDSAWQASP